MVPVTMVISKCRKKLNSQELRRQIQLLTKLKRQVTKLCRELNYQRNCLDHVEDFANFLKHKTTYTVTTPVPEADNLAETATITVNQAHHYYPSYDEEFQIHHQKFDRDFHYFRSKYAKLNQTNTVSSLYDSLYSLFENCHVLGENAEDSEFHKSLFDLEMAEREKLQQSLPNAGDLEATELGLLGDSASTMGPSTSAGLTVVPTLDMTTKKKKKRKRKKLPRKKLKDKTQEIAPGDVKQRKKKKKSEKGRFQCPMVSCNKEYKFKDNLLKHLLQHVEVKTEVLDDMNNETVSLPKRGRKRRVRTESSGSEPQQPVRRKRRKSSLTGESVYRCDFDGCQYTAPYRSALELHKVKHSTERPFKCNHCEKCFKQIYALKMHEMIHSGQQFQCPFTGCSAIYSWIYSLKKHMRIHTNQAPVHRCEWPACEYQTHRQDLLRKHMTRHTGERLFDCTWPDCGKSFKTRSGLYDHLLMHKNERKQVCTWPGCNYRCNLPGNLRKHIAIHEKKVIKLDQSMGVADQDQISLLTHYNGGIVSGQLNLHQHHD